MRIAVTGAYGQLGGEICRQLGGAALPFDIDTLDLTNPRAVAGEFATTPPDAVVNCAAYTQVDRAEEDADACRAVNVSAVKYLAQVCRKAGCPLVQISTDYVFSGDADRTVPYHENDPPSPQGVYAQTKLDGERAAAECPRHLVVRTCGLYAQPGDERAANFVKTMLRLGRSRDELRVVADQHCTPSYVPHVARAVVVLLGTGGTEAAPWGTYHVTNRGATTWYDLAAELFRLAKIDVSLQPITTAEYGAAAPRPAYSVLDTAKYHALDLTDMPSWQAALAEYIEAMEEEA